MRRNISRRHFLNLGGIGLGGMTLAGLHHSVDASSEARRLGDPISIDDEQPAMPCQERLLSLARQFIPHLFTGCRSIHQDRRPITGAIQDVEPVEETRVVNRYEVGTFDLVRGSNRTRPEPQVRDGGRTGLLGVVDEIPLCEQVGLLTED